MGKPVAIWHEGDAKAFRSASPENQDAWNEYAQKCADEFNTDPDLDSYDSTQTSIGVDRDGKITRWCPPLFFPEWLANRHAAQQKQDIQ